MAAGTVISGGFPGRVAQEVQPNPKCNGCLHFDGQGGRTGVCTIGERPWNCGEGDAADIGYAPISRGAGSYLPPMSNHSAQAREVDDQDTSNLTGAGSTRAVQFVQVSLGEEHIHFVKSYLQAHEQLQKSMCRLCQSSNMIGTAPANVGYQVCTCAPITALQVAKALHGKLSNLAKSVISVDDLKVFVHDVAKSKTRTLEKATFFHTHGKYEVTPAGGGKHTVTFHPRGGGEPHHIATTSGGKNSHREARDITRTHAQVFGQGTPGPHKPTTGEKKESGTSTSAWTMPHLKVKKAADGECCDECEGDDEVEKAEHPHDLKPGDLIVHSGGNAGFHNPESPYRHGQIAQVHAVRKNPHTGETHVQVKHHLSNGKMSGVHSLSSYDSSRHPTAEDMQAHSKTLKRHFNAKAKIKNAQAAQAPAMPTTEKSFGSEIDDTILTAEVSDDMEKSLRWSHKDPGEASTSHGKYTVHHDVATGHHVVTYKPKGSDKGYQKKFGSHREALGAVVEHHLKNRPPPKPRKKKDPNAPKAPKGAGAGNCPPCP